MQLFVELIQFSYSLKCQMASRSPKSDIVIFGRVTVTTIGAASFFQRTAILQVTTNALRVLETGSKISQRLSLFLYNYYFRWNRTSGYQGHGREHDTSQDQGLQYI